MTHFDIAIVGGGIVGASAALALKRACPAANIILLEKEQSAALHQTGRNSGVIHAGVYYQPGSLKAQYCRQGLERTIAFCQDNQIPYLQCGKLLVATNESELERMDALFTRCQENGLAPERISRPQLKQQEPNVEGLGAFLVRQTGITDYKRMTSCILQQFESLGGRVQFDAQVIDVNTDGGRTALSLSTSTGEKFTIHSEFTVNCAGLHSDNVIKKFGLSPEFQIIPFKGEYFRLAPQHNKIVSRLIYPIPDPSMPFLGVHLTRMIDGSVTVGPSAVLSLAKEGYNKHAFDLHDVANMVSYSGFWKVLWQHRAAGVAEFKNSLFISSYLKEVQKYCPSLTASDLLSYPSGIRAQAVTQQGKLVHDFLFVEGEHSLHIGNAPSPAATSAFPIADAIVERVLPRLE